MSMSDSTTSTTIIKYTNTDGHEALFGLKVDDRVYFTAKGTIKETEGNPELIVDNVITTITNVTNKDGVKYILKNNDADADATQIELKSIPESP